VIVTLAGLRIETAPEWSELTWKLKDLVGWNRTTFRNDAPDMPSSDGAHDPERSYRSSKSMSLQGFILSPSAETAEEFGWNVLNALAPEGEDYELQVETPVRTYYMRVRLTSIDVIPITDRRARFQVGLLAVDARKYGPLPDTDDMPSASAAGGSNDGLEMPLIDTTVSFGAFSPTGLLQIYNGGTAPSWVTFRARGSIDSTGFQIISGADVIEFKAAVPAGKELLLDPYAGGRAILDGVDVTGGSLTRSEWPPVMPKQTRLYSFDPNGTADANARLIAEFREAWW
jgi:hypothetical protein